VTVAEDRSSITTFPIDLTDHRQTGAIAGEILEDGFDRCLGTRRARDMRRDAHTRVSPKRMTRRQRFGLRYIEERITQVAFVEQPQQIVLPQVRAAPV